MDLTHNDVESILKIIDAAEHLAEVEIVHGGFRLRVARNGSTQAAQPQPMASLEPAAAAHVVEPSVAARNTVAVVPAVKAAEPNPEGIVTIRAPMLGVFYRASAPGEPPFVEVGQRVNADDIVCLIEVMKLFSSIRAGVSGEVVRILVDNGALVEFEQPLIFVKPNTKD